MQEEIIEAQLQIVKLKRDRMAEVFELMRDNSDALFVLEPRLMAAHAALERAELRSPTAGYVVDLRIFTEGGVISAGERISTSSRNSGRWSSKPRSTQRISTTSGWNSRPKSVWSDFRQRSVPVIHGTIRWISADRLVEERSGAPYYKAIVEVDASELARTPEIRLVTGMPVELVVSLKPRTALDYLLEPLYESFGHAFRE